MTQTKLESFIESITNTLIGILISSTANYLILPMFYDNVTFKNSLYIAIIFTLISVCRNYFIRRVFEGRVIEDV